MKFSLRAFCAFLCMAALCFLFGCQSPAPEKSVQTAPSGMTVDAAELYISASESVLSGQNLSMQLQVQTDTRVGNSLFRKHSDQTLSLMNIGTEYMHGALDETLQSGSQSVTIRERYTNGMLYMTVNGSRFVSSTTAQEYQARFITTHVFTPSLYAAVTAADEAGDTRITFASASAPEGWSVPAEAQWVSSEGNALVCADGTLASCSYTVCYRSANAEITSTWQITYDNKTLPSIDVPASTDDYVELPDARIPRLLEEVTGYLTQADSISARSIHQIHSEAFGISRQQESQLHFAQLTNAVEAYRNSTVELISHSSGDEVTVTSQMERFSNNAYRIETNGQAVAGFEPITAEQMRNYCHTLLVSSVLLPEYITGVTMTQNEQVYRLDFTATESLAQLICSNTCKTLYDDSQLLNALASAYVTDEITAYLEIDILTGLPVASGIHYSGTHTIQQTTYALSSRFDQVYTPVSQIDWDVLDSSGEDIPTESTTDLTVE